MGGMGAMGGWQMGAHAAGMGMECAGMGGMAAWAAWLEVPGRRGKKQMKTLTRTDFLLQFVWKPPKPDELPKTEEEREEPSSRRWSTSWTRPRRTTRR